MKEGLARRRAIQRLVGSCLLVLLLILSAGCGRTSVFDGSMTADENGFRMEYSVLNREETADLKLAEGDRLEVELYHDSGTVDVKIGQPGKDTIYTGTGQTDAEFTLEIPESGVYRVSVAGHQAKGRVAFVRVPAAAE